MKKIMFSDKYGLTKAVLDGRKTQTRRILKWNTYVKPMAALCQGKLCVSEIHHQDETSCYSIGETLAIAQSYYDVFGTETPLIEGAKDAGVFNKMFVKADLMPHHIRITNIRVERLQDISDEDCIKEGIIEDCPGVQYSFPTEIGYCGQYPFDTPKAAYAALIDKVSGKGTWESNPLVFVYDFELVR